MKIRFWNHEFIWRKMREDDPQPYNWGCPNLSRVLGALIQCQTVEGLIYYKDVQPELQKINDYLESR